MTSLMRNQAAREWSRTKARTTDPETSKQAIIKMTPEQLNRNQQAVLEAMRRLGSRASDTELVYEYRNAMHDLPMQSFSGIRTRRKELVEMGKVADIGLRVHTESGREAIVWSLIG